MRGGGWGDTCSLFSGPLLLTPPVPHSRLPWLGPGLQRPELEKPKDLSLVQLCPGLVPILSSHWGLLDYKYFYSFTFSLASTSLLLPRLQVAAADSLRSQKPLLFSHWLLGGGLGEEDSSSAAASSSQAFSPVLGLDLEAKERVHSTEG